MPRRKRKTMVLRSNNVTNVRNAGSSERQQAQSHIKDETANNTPQPLIENGAWNMKMQKKPKIAAEKPTTAIFTAIAFPIATSIKRIFFIRGSS